MPVASTTPIDAGPISSTHRLLHSHNSASSALLARRSPARPTASAPKAAVSPSAPTTWRKCIASSTAVPPSGAGWRDRRLRHLEHADHRRLTGDADVHVL